MVALNAALPLLSLLLGAGITYWLNVRGRKQGRIEEVFHEAISAVAVAVASKDFIASVGPWRGARPEDTLEFTARLGREGNLNYVRAVAAARAAVARASAYRPDLAPYYKAGTDTIVEQADAVIALLRQGPGK